MTADSVSPGSEPGPRPRPAQRLAHRLARRLARRETHSPRSALAITLAVIVMLAAVWFGIEIVLSMVRHPALLVAPTDAEAAIVSVPTIAAPILIAAGVVLAILGVVLIVAAVSAGRRARHVIRADRLTTVVDDGVIASALARHAAYAGGTSRENVRVRVTRSRAVVDVTPASGSAADTAAITEAVDAQLGAYDLHPRLRSRVTLRRIGKVGA